MSACCACPFSSKAVKLSMRFLWSCLSFCWTCLFFSPPKSYWHLCEICVFIHIRSETTKMSSNSSVRQSMQVVKSPTLRVITNWAWVCVCVSQHVMPNWHSWLCNCNVRRTNQVAYRGLVELWLYDTSETGSNMSLHYTHLKHNTHNHNTWVQN